MELRSDVPPDSYAVDNLYNSHPALMQIAVHRRVTDPTIACSMTVCMLSALKSHGKLFFSDTRHIDKMVHSLDWLAHVMVSNIIILKSEEMGISQIYNWLSITA